MAESRTEAPGWDAIEAHEGFGGVRVIVEQQLIPALEQAPVEEATKQGAPKNLSGMMSGVFGVGVLLFLSTFLFLPDTWWGTTLRFIAFPLCFVLAGAVFVRLNWRGLMEYFLRAEARLGVRADGLQAVAGHLGLSYVPMPGGPPAALSMLARQSWMPGEFREMVARMEAHGGMDGAVAAARRAGVLTPDVVVLGSEETKRKYRAQQEASQELEDGFHGVRKGVGFDMFEWVEHESDAPNVYHLVVVLKAPFALEGVTELRSRHIGWLRGADKVTLQPVSLEAVRFADHYRLRASDQIESRALFNPAVIERVLALADRGKFRGVASGRDLVFAFEGTNRFALLDLGTGAWGETSIRRGLGDLADALGLVDALAHAFMLRRGG